MNNIKYYYRHRGEEWQEHFGAIKDGKIIQLWINHDRRLPAYISKGKNSWVTKIASKCPDNAWNIPHDAEYISEKEFKRRMFIIQL